MSLTGTQATDASLLCSVKIPGEAAGRGQRPQPDRFASGGQSAAFKQSIDTRQTAPERHIKLGRIPAATG